VARREAVLYVLRPFRRNEKCVVSSQVIQIAYSLHASFYDQQQGDTISSRVFTEVNYATMSSNATKTK
jgi:hypothetical protein